MELIVENAGKKFSQNWIFRHINVIFESDKQYAITGNNGAGKTTFLKILAGIMPLSEGSIVYKNQEQLYYTDSFFKYISLVGPYTELIEEFTLKELFFFYSKFKQITLKFDELLSITNFHKVKSLQIKNFSSGMKQKLKLALALFTESEILLLDEPTSNFDKENINWYLENIKRASKDKILIICSNQQYEYSFCQKVLDVNIYK